MWTVFTGKDTLAVLLVAVWMNTVLWNQFTSKLTGKFCSTTDNRTACLHESFQLTFSLKTVKNMEVSTKLK